MQTLKDARRRRSVAQMMVSVGRVIDDGRGLWTPYLRRMAGSSSKDEAISAEREGREAIGCKERC